jgi:hypothetical protein
VRPVAALAAITMLLLTAMALRPAATADAATPAAARPAQTVDGTATLRMDLTTMTPRVVTSDGPQTLTLSGTLTNTGSQQLDDLTVRVQRSSALTTEGAVRDALDGDAAADNVTPDFRSIASGLVPGASVPFTFTVPLRGGPTEGLALTSPGVYELLVNVNGAPTGGPRARVAAARMLLPVSSLPADPTGAKQAAPARKLVGTQFSMLYPIADRPHRIGNVPREQVTLDDDSLAASFAPNGRLNGLVSAFAEQAPAGSQMRAATCLAIDPDLVDTAVAMKDRYDVRQPDGTVKPGGGQAAASQWLDQLGAIARTGCVISMPFADADLVALTRGDLAPVATSAITDGREALTENLDLPATAALPPVTWPAEGMLDEPGLEAVSKAGDKAVILSADSVAQGRTRTTSGVTELAGGPDGSVAALTDPLLSLAAGGPPGGLSLRGGIPAIGGAAATTTIAGTTSPLSTQDVVGALMFRAQTATADSDADGPLVLAPPQLWQADGVGARALLSTIARLVQDGGLIPRNLVTALQSGPRPDAPARELDYPLDAPGREIPAAAVDTIRDAGADLDDLVAAAEPDPDGVLTPQDAFGAVRQGMFRGVSATLRGDPDGALRVADLNADRVAELRAKVAVVQPPVPYALGTSDAPLPLIVTNGLPVTIRVDVAVTPQSGLTASQIPEQRIPPLGRRQLSVNAKVTRSGQFSVEATVRTPGGKELGSPSRLKVVSSAYGTITIWLTATAGVLLVALVARRVLRRLRGEQGGTPEPAMTVPVLPDLPDHSRHGSGTDRHPVPYPPRDGPRRVPGPGPRVPEHLAVTQPVQHPAPTGRPPSESGPGGAHPGRTPTPRP